MKIIHVFRSGNDCIVTLPERLAKGELSGFNVEWEVWPPSPEDRQEWSESVFPLKVIPACERLARKEHGTGFLHQVMPGIWVWKAGMIQ